MSDISVVMEDENSKTMAKKRKNDLSDESSSSSSNKDAVSHKTKRYKSKESKYKKSDKNKKSKASSSQKKKQLNQESSGRTKEDYMQFVRREKDKDKQIELEVWYYLIHNLEESEKLIALKYLVSINKIKENWRDNGGNKNCVNKKVVDNLELVIKTLQEEQKKSKEEIQNLIQAKIKLEKMVVEERKCRLQLMGILAHELEKSKQQVKNKVDEPKKVEESVKVDELKKVEVPNETENKQHNQTTTDIVLKQKPSSSTSKTLAYDDNNNTQTSKAKVDLKKEVDLRDVIKNKESGGNREHDISLSQPPMRQFPPAPPHSHYKRFPSRLDDRLCVFIETTIHHVSDLIKLIKHKLRIPLYTRRITPVNGGWKIEFFSVQDKMNFLKRKWEFSGTGLHVMNLFRSTM